MGDLNADMFSHSNSHTKFIRDLMDELSLKLVSTGLTHHTSSSSTWIDLLLVDQCETVKDSNRVLPPILSRHDIISVIITKFSPTTPPPTVTYRIIAEVVPQDLESYLQNCDW